jgi:hypothetical protein
MRAHNMHEADCAADVSLTLPEHALAGEQREGVPQVVALLRAKFRQRSRAGTVTAWAALLDKLPHKVQVLQAQCATPLTAATFNQQFSLQAAGISPDS